MSTPALNRRNFLRTAGAGAAALPLAWAGCSPSGNGKPPGSPPNFVVIYTDDMGYGDWEFGGDPTILTPNLRRMAAEGVRLTQFYAGAAVCTPSRAALLTGRNPIRNGMISVLFPPHDRGLPQGETTIARALAPAGYRSAIIGKWHLGHTPEYLPLKHSFDYFFGLLYSNDMLPADFWRNDRPVEQPADQTRITQRYTKEAIGFIERNRDNPFFLYLAHAMPHAPLFASAAFKGRSRRGFYGDVIAELDWSVGEVLSALERLGLADNTLVIFTSDNGPAKLMNAEGGDTGMLRGAKGDTWEGGWRAPFAARWPGRLPAGQVSTAVGSVLDLLPTFCGLAGAPLPGRPLDGIDLWPTLTGEADPVRTIFYYWDQHLCAVRRGQWKLHLRYYDHSSGKYMVDQNWVTPRVPLLFDVEADPAERFDRAGERPEVVLELSRVAQDYQAEIKRLGENRELVDWFVNVWPTLPRTSTSLEKIR